MRPRCCAIHACHYPPVAAALNKSHFAAPQPDHLLLIHSICCSRPFSKISSGLQSTIYNADYNAASMTAEDVPNTPAAAGWGSDLASRRPLTPQQGTTPGITPISKAIALLQHRSNTTPNASQGRTQRTAELSARKAELATLLNLVTQCCNLLACPCIA